MNILIRDVSPAVIEAIRRETERLGVNQQKLLTDLLKSIYGDPPLVIAYVKVDRPGEYDGDCPECDQPAENWYVKFMDNGAYSLVCGICATSE